MAVLPWGHSRTRTASAEDKKSIALDWFSRSSAEPSRHALTELMRQHSRNLSAGSNSSHSRSRPDTASSQHSQYCGAVAECSGALQSRPTSPSYSIASAVERPTGSSKTLFSRGSVLRRKSSIMSLNSDAGSTTSVISPSRFTSSRLGFRRKDSSLSSPTKSPAISQPFAFHHVVHTEQMQFNDLSRIDESELASAFGTMQASAQAQEQLKGIQASELGVVTPPPSSRPADQPSSPTSVQPLRLPLTPPRPAPPPKDSPRKILIPMGELRTSRSIENFSRPAPRSPITPGGNSPIRNQGRLSYALLPPLTEITTANDHGAVKPLPLLPSVIHAVSTDDDTARCMKSSPLPMLPTQQPQHKRQASSKSSLRHMSTFPSPKHHRPGYSQHDGPLSGIKEEHDRLPRHHSEDALSNYLRNSINAGKVCTSPIDEWEDAIDYAWDQAEGGSGNHGPGSVVDGRSASQANEGAIGGLQSPVHGQVSSSSTPLMMSSSPSVSQTSSFVSGTDQSERDSSDVVGDHLSGLGIDSRAGSPVLSRVSRPPTIGLSIPEEGQFDTSRLPRSTYSTLSKSSSQESIILSIASSIMGTQRSSNSSVNPSDLARLSKWEDPSSPATLSPNHLFPSSSKSARPESTCVPPALLQGFSVSTNDQVASSSEPIDDSSGDTTSETETDIVAPLSLHGKHERAISSSASAQLYQAASAMSPGQRSARQRSGSSASRRPVRASYTLFPTTTTSPISSST